MFSKAQLILELESLMDKDDLNDPAKFPQWLQVLTLTADSNKDEDSWLGKMKSLKGKVTSVGLETQASLTKGFKMVEMAMKKLDREGRKAGEEEDSPRRATMVVLEDVVKTITNSNSSNNSVQAAQHHNHGEGGEKGKLLWGKLKRNLTTAAARESQLEDERTGRVSVTLTNETMQHIDEDVHIVDEHLKGVDEHVRRIDDHVSTLEDHVMGEVRVVENSVNGVVARIESLRNENRELRSMMGGILEMLTEDRKEREREKETERERERERERAMERERMAAL